MPDETSRQPPLPTASIESLEAEWQRVLLESQRPLDAGLPPDALATPAHVTPWRPGDSVDWWQPSWRDAWKHLGWRWFLLVPGILFILLTIFALFWHGFRDPLFIVEIKLLIFLAAAVFSLLGFVLRRAARARRDPFCVFCGYNLTGLPDNYRCPECGRPYTWRLIGEYRRDPQWFIERYEAFRRLPPPAQPFDAGPVRRKRRDGT